MNEIKPKESIAYFSMEIGLESKMPTYSGGLGMLAGDTIRSAADMGIPLVAVTLLHRKGYFTQHLDAAGWQQEQPVEWRPEEFRNSTLVAARFHHHRAQASKKAFRAPVQAASP